MVWTHFQDGGFCGGLCINSEAKFHFAAKLTYPHEGIFLIGTHIADLIQHNVNGCTEEQLPYYMYICSRYLSAMLCKIRIQFSLIYDTNKKFVDMKCPRLTSNHDGLGIAPETVFE